jgi:hypothetical protein
MQRIGEILPSPMSLVANIESRVIAARERVPKPVWVALPFVIAIGVVWLYYSELLGTGAKTCHRDWIYFHTMAAVSRESLFGFSTVPLWNSFTCGGIEHLGNPQTAFLSPLYVLILVFGVSYGLKLFIVAHLAAGAVGAVFLGREIGLRWGGQAVFATFLIGCSFFPWHVHAGHVTFVQLAWLPWILWCYLRARRSWTYLAVGALFLALALLSGGTYVAPFAMVLMGAHAILAGSNETPRWRPLAIVAGIAVLGALVAAIKILPSMEFVSAYKRPDLPKGVTTMSSEHLLAALFDSKWRAKELKLEAWEYGNFVGVWSAWLALLLVPWAVRKHWPWVVVAALAALLSLGDFAAWAPYSLLTKLPVFGSLRVPSRYTLLLVFAAAMAAAYGAVALRERARQWPVGWRLSVATGVALVATLATAGLVLSNRDLVSAKICKGDPGKIDKAERFHIIKGKFERMWEYPQNGMGTDYCRAPMKYRRGAIWRGDRSQVEVQPRQAGTAELVRFAPGHWELHASLKAPAKVRLNQNYRDSMRVSSGKLVKERGLIAVELPAGEHDVQIDFWSPAISRGLWMTFLGLLLVLAVFCRRWLWQRWRQAIGGED